MLENIHQGKMLVWIRIKGRIQEFFFSLSLYCERVFFNFFINFSGIYKLLQFEADPRSGFLDQV